VEAPGKGMAARTGNRSISGFSFFISVIIFFVTTSNIFAALGINLQQSVIYDNNVFRNSSAHSDMIYVSELHLSYPAQFHKIRVNWNYSGGLFTYQDYNEHRFNTNSLWTNFYTPILNNVFIRAHLGIVYNQQGEEYSIFDNRRIQFSSQLQSNITRSFVHTLGYAHERKTYPHTSEISYSENNMISIARLFFRSRTTFIWEVRFSQKNYTNESSSSQIVLYEKDNNGQYYGSGKGGPFGNGNNGKEGASSHPDSSIMVTNISQPDVSQFYMKIKIAQSLSNSTGLGLEFSRFFPANQLTRFITGQDFSYDDNNELYDDHYTYESKVFSVSITQLLPFAVKINSHFSYGNKQYNYSLYDETTQKNNRDDIHIKYGIGILKTFAINKPFMNEMDINIDALWLNNKSNEEYFDYDSLSILFKIDILF